MNNLERDSQSFDAKFAGGVAWTAGVKWMTQIFTWGSVLLLTRLLTPNDYGLGAMGSQLFTFSNVIAEFGVGTAVLHMPELTRKSLAQLHTVSCVICTLFFLLATAFSPLVASFYKSDHVLFFMTNNLILFITGFQAIPMGLLARDMDYRRMSLAEASMALVQAAVSVIAALMGFGYWTFIAGQLAGRTTAAIMVCRWKHVGFAWPRWKDIEAPLQLGRQTAIGRLAWALYVQSDAIIVGRTLGSSVLGFYGMAMELSSAPAEKVSSLIMRAGTPLFANVKDDHALVRRYNLILAEMLSLAIMPLMIGLAMVAPLAISVIFGDKWLPAVGPVRCLALFVILRSLNTLNEQVLISQKITRFTMRLSILNCVLMPLAFIVSARYWSIQGVAASWLVMAPLTMIPLAWKLFRTIRLSIREYLSSLAPATVGSMVMCGALALSQWWFRSHSIPQSVALVVQIAGGGTVYLAVVFGLFGSRISRYTRFVRGLRKPGATASAESAG